MKQPQGLMAQGKEHLCKLDRSIYGLKQSPPHDAGTQCWTIKQLKKMGFVQSVSDPRIYVALDGETFVIGVYRDDTVLAGESDNRIAEVKAISWCAF